MPNQRLVAALALAALLPVDPAAANDALPVEIAWTRCPVDLTGIWPTLGNRLSCARLPVPVDYRDPTVGTIDLGIVRVRTALNAERRGAIFFNFGGPGGNPMEWLPDLAASWAAADPENEIEAPRKQLFDHYDLVAVVPRGLRGGWVFECVPPLTSPYEFIPSDTSEANLRRVEEHAGNAARKCNENPFYKYVNTEQNARDMEYVRRVLGEPKLNYLGMSYGSWLGAWYASMFPEKVGRMVFDSSMNVASTFADGVMLTLAAEDETLERRVLRPAAARPDVYGLGGDMSAIRRRLRNMHPWPRRHLASAIATPAHLVAALKLDEWISSGKSSFRSTLEARIGNTRFSEDGRADAAVRKAATALLSRLFPSRPPPDYELGGPDGDSVHMATLCNDEVWQGGFAYWRDLARTNAIRYPTSNGEEIYVGLFCSQWGPRAINRPHIGLLTDAPPFLIVQAEYDHSTPLSGAEDVRDTFPNAHLVIARNMEWHGIYGKSHTPCVERAVGEFLLNGVLPAERTTSCLNEPLLPKIRPPQDALHSHTEFWKRPRF